MSRGPWKLLKKEPHGRNNEFEGEDLEAEACVSKVAMRLAEQIVKPIRT